MPKGKGTYGSKTGRPPKKKVIQSVKKEHMERKNNADAISLYRM